MSQRICLRCDWTGQLSSQVCPRCGTGLYREAERRRSRPPSIDRLDRSPEVEPPEIGDRRDGGGSLPATGRALRSIVTVVALVALIAVAFDRMGASDRPSRATGQVEPTVASEGSSALARPPTGRLVYLGRTDAGRQGLWVLDLLTGTVGQGPALDRTPVELVDASGAARGWIGIESRALHGELVAQVLETLEPEALPRRLTGGSSLLAWGPGGVSVAAARVGPSRGPCPSVAIDVVAVRTGSAEPVLAPGAVCGPIFGLGRSSVATYFSGDSEEGFGLQQVGAVGVPHLLFRNARLVGSSPVSAFLVREQSEPDRPPLAWTLLRWRRTGAPVRFQEDGLPFVLNRVLGWSADALRVAVSGSVGPRDGLFILDATPDSGWRSPSFVAAIFDGDASFASDGSLFIASQGRLLRAADGELLDVSLPRGAPAPVGPILWLP